MSLATTGYNLGKKFGNAISQVFSIENQGMIIAHRIKGRRRYTCLALKGRDDLCAHLNDILSQFPGITDVKINKVTGSVVVCYNQKESVINDLFDLLSHNIAGKHAQQEKTAIPSSVITVSDNITDAVRNTFGDIKTFFSHTEPLFLSRLAGIALVGYGIMRMVANGDRPAGPQLLLWGLALMMRQGHKDPPHVDDPESVVMGQGEAI